MSYISPRIEPCCASCWKRLFSRTGPVALTLPMRSVCHFCGKPVTTGGFICAADNDTVPVDLRRVRFVGGLDSEEMETIRRFLDRLIHPRPA